MLIIRTALREMRGAFRHFAFFLVCIALGVGALHVGIHLVDTRCDPNGLGRAARVAGEQHDMIHARAAKVGDHILTAGS